MGVYSTLTHVCVKNGLIVETSLIGKALSFGLREYGFEPCVSNKVHFINPYAYTYSHYRINVAQKKIYFDMLVTRRILPVLTLFCKLNVIRRFYFLKTENSFSRKVRIFPFYTKLQSHSSNIKLHFRKVRPVSIQLKALKLLTKRSGASSLILNTSAGLITHQEAMKLGIGGVLVYTLN